MTEPKPREPDRFAIVPIYADSSGSEVKFPGAIMTGSMSAVMARIKNSRQMREDLRISNEADKVRRVKAQLKADAAALEAERADFAVYANSVKADALQDFIQKLDALTAQIESLEAARAKAADPNEQPSPPGYPDDGELQVKPQEH